MTFCRCKTWDMTLILLDYYAIIVDNRLSTTLIYIHIKGGLGKLYFLQRDHLLWFTVCLRFIEPLLKRVILEEDNFLTRSKLLTLRVDLYLIIKKKRSMFDIVASLQMFLYAFYSHHVNKYITTIACYTIWCNISWVLTPWWIIYDTFLIYALNINCSVR